MRLTPPDFTGLPKVKHPVLPSDTVSSGNPAGQGSEKVLLTAFPQKSNPLSGIQKPPTPLVDVIHQIITTLGLPKDTLSQSLVMLARTFSLPLDPALLTKLRKNVLALKTNNEAAALGAVAAESKGVELQPGTLEDYVKAIDPDARNSGGNSGSAEDGTGERKQSQDQSGGNTAGQNETRAPSAANKEGSADADLEPEGLTPAFFKKKLEAIEANSLMLRFLNTIPGKDNSRWIVIPFTYTIHGIEYEISIRMLLKEGKSSEYIIETLSVDILGGKRRWVFAISNPGEHGSQAAVAVNPPLEEKERKRLERELTDVLGPYVQTIRVGNNSSAGMFGYTMNNDLPSVNEEV